MPVIGIVVFAGALLLVAIVWLIPVDRAHPPLDDEGRSDADMTEAAPVAAEQVPVRLAEPGASLATPAAPAQQAPAFETTPEPPSTITSTEIPIALPVPVVVAVDTAVDPASASGLQAESSGPDSISARVDAATPTPVEATPESAVSPPEPITSMLKPFMLTTEPSQEMPEPGDEMLEPEINKPESEPAVLREPAQTSLFRARLVNATATASSEGGAVTPSYPFTLPIPISMSSIGQIEANPATEPVPDPVHVDKSVLVPTSDSDGESGTGIDDLAYGEHVSGQDTESISRVPTQPPFANRSTATSSVIWSPHPEPLPHSGWMTLDLRSGSQSIVARVVNADEATRRNMAIAAGAGVLLALAVARR